MVQFRRDFYINKMILTTLISTYLALLCIVIKSSSAFRLEIENLRPLMALEPEYKNCGCEEKSSLIQLRSKILTPEDFMIDHGKLWLGAVEASVLEECANLCPYVSARTSHFTFEGKKF